MSGNVLNCDIHTLEPMDGCGCSLSEFAFEMELDLSFIDDSNDLSGVFHHYLKSLNF